MGEKFVKVTPGTDELARIMYELAHFVDATEGQSAIQIVGAGSDAPALYNGTEFVDAFVSEDDFPEGAYFVVEPVTEYPGGGVWQLKVEYVDDDNLSVTLSINGGWTNEEGFGDAPCTAVTRVVTHAPTAGDELYIAASDLETYNESVDAYSFFWFNLSRGSEVEQQQVCYAGGYVPVDPDTDLRPVVLLARVPGRDNTNNYFGRNAASSVCLSRLAAEYVHTSSLVTAGYAFVVGAPLNGLGKNYNGTYLATPLYLCRVSVDNVLGYFGSLTMLSVDNKKPMFEIPDGDGYIHMNGILFRWKP